MKAIRPLLPALFALALAVSPLGAAEPVQSGPQVGSKLPGAFEPFNVNGSNAGEECCLYCKYGNSPVVMVFARRVDQPLTKLIKKLDAAAEKNKSAQVGACVLFLSGDKALRTELAKLANREELKHVVLGTIEPAEVKEYAIAPDADVTVVLYAKLTVKSNFAFRKGELDAKAADQVVGELPKILPAK